MPSRSGPRKPGQSGPVFDCCRRRRGRGRLVGGLGQKPLLGSLRPTPGKVGRRSARHAAGAHERAEAARGQNRRNHGGTPRAVGKAPAGGSPDNKGEAQDGDGINEEHQPHHPRRNGDMHEAQSRGERGDHQERAAPAIEAGRAAEKRPPHEDQQPGHQAPNNAHEKRVRQDDGDEKSKEPLQGHEDHAGPKAQGFWGDGFVGAARQPYDVNTKHDDRDCKRKAIMRAKRSRLA